MNDIAGRPRAAATSPFPFDEAVVVRPSPTDGRDAEQDEEYVELPRGVWAEEPSPPRGGGAHGIDDDAVWRSEPEARSSALRGGAAYRAVVAPRRGRSCSAGEKATRRGVEKGGGTPQVISKREGFYSLSPPPRNLGFDADVDRGRGRRRGSLDRTTAGAANGDSASHGEVRHRWPPFGAPESATKAASVSRERNGTAAAATTFAPSPSRSTPESRFAEKLARAGAGGGRAADQLRDDGDVKGRYRGRQARVGASTTPEPKIEAAASVSREGAGTASPATTFAPPPSRRSTPESRFEEKLARAAGGRAADQLRDGGGKERYRRRRPRGIGVGVRRANDDAPTKAAAVATDLGPSPAQLEQSPAVTPESRFLGQHDKEFGVRQEAVGGYDENAKSGGGDNAKSEQPPVAAAADTSKPGAHVMKGPTDWEVNSSDEHEHDAGGGGGSSFLANEQGGGGGGDPMLEVDAAAASVGVGMVMGVDYSRAFSGYVVQDQAMTAAATSAAGRVGAAAAGRAGYQLPREEVIDGIPVTTGGEETRLQRQLFENGATEDGLRGTGAAGGDGRDGGGDCRHAPTTSGAHDDAQPDELRPIAAFVGHHRIATTVVAVVLVATIMTTAAMTGILLARSARPDGGAANAAGLGGNTEEEAMTTTTPDASPGPSSARTTTARFDALRAVVAGSVSSPAALDLVEDDDDTITLLSPPSPQRRALAWLADVDSAAVPANDTRRVVQRYALAVLYFATGGDASWKTDLNFLSEAHECEWNGVTPNEWYRQGGEPGREGVFCDRTTITQIKMFQMNMTGTVPDELSALTAVWDLQLWQNELRGPISETGIWDLYSLQILQLDENYFSGTLPDSVANLRYLEDLSIVDNVLSGYLPQSLTELKDNLRVMRLHLNGLSGTIPAGLGDISALWWCLLGNNELTGPIPSTIGRLKNLKRLNWERNSLTGTLPESIGNLPVREIHLWGNRLRGSIPASIAKNSDLFSLGLGGNEFTSSVPETIFDLPNLGWLSLESNNLSGSLPESGSLETLRAMLLHSNPSLVGTLPPWIGNNTELRVLELGSSGFSGTVPQSFEKLTGLEWLNIGGNALTGDVGFLCNNSIPMFIADCGGNEESGNVCTCCTSQCNRFLDTSQELYWKYRG